MAASGKIVWVGRVISVLASLVFQIALGIFVWLGLYVREPRLKALIPIGTP